MEINGGFLEQPACDSIQEPCYGERAAPGRGLPGTWVGTQARCTSHPPEPSRMLGAGTVHGEQDPVQGAGRSLHAVAGECSMLMQGVMMAAYAGY